MCIVWSRQGLLFNLVTPEMDYINNIKLTIHTYRKIQVTVNIGIVSHLLHSLWIYFKCFGSASD